MKRIALVLLCLLIGAPLWATTSNVSVQEGGSPTKYMATNSISEDAATKQLQRQVPNNSSGTEIFTAAAPAQVSLANTGANATAINVAIASGNPTTITATQGTGTNLHTVVDSGAITATLSNSAKVDCNSSNITIAGGSIANTTFGATQGTASNLKTESHLYDSSTNGIGSTSNALDINIKSGNPTTITATQGTATNLKTEAECYQGGTAVGSANPIYARTQVESGLATSVTKTKVVAYTASQTGTTVVAATNGTTMYITDIVISASAAGTVYLFDDTDSSTAEITPNLSLAANGGFVSNFKKPFVTSAVSHTIKYTSGSGAAGSIFIQYYEI